MRAWLIVGLLLCQAGALGQEANEPTQEPKKTRRDRMRELRQKAVRLIRATQELGNWDEHYEYMVDATERVFERNGWNSESDLFSLEMVREVGAIPPWAIRARHDKFMEMVGDRYLLEEDQMASLQSLAIRLSVDIFSRHADRITEYALEAVQTRAAGEPFTPEQIARWTTLAEPVFKNVRRSVNTASEEFMEELDPEQRELVKLDLEAANRRMDGIERMAQKWKRGQWDPRDWGMEHDPIQNPGALSPEAPAAGETKPGPEQPPAQVAPEPAGTPEATPRADGRTRSGDRPRDDDAWARYVREFIRKYDLNNEQQQRAWLIYRDAKQRDEVFERRYRRQVEALHQKARGADDEKTQAALRERTEKHRGERERLFNQLKRRLERLPTRAQRKSAEPDETDVADSPTRKAEPTKQP